MTERKEAVRERDSTWAGFLPFDPVTGNAYVNAIGTSPAEAAVNLSSIDIDDSVAARLEYLAVEFRPSGEGKQEVDGE